MLEEALAVLTIREIIKILIKCFGGTVLPAVIIMKIYNSFKN